MAIFRISKNKVIKSRIKDDGFGDEFSLRDFFADNLEELLGIRFIEKEYPIQEGRIDTLGLDGIYFPPSRWNAIDTKRGLKLSFLF